MVSTSSLLLVGVLELQGDFLEHEAMLKRCGVKPVPVRTKDDLKGIEGLVIPGGESTTMGRLLIEFDMLSSIRDLGTHGLPLFGTCAGCILLAKNIVGRPTQTSLNLLDISVDRNSYGPQIDSFETEVYSPAFGSAPLRAVLIRAPKIVETGPQVEILAARSSQGEPVLVRQQNILAASFHPELTDDDRVHRLFVDMVRQRKTRKEN